MSKFSKAEEAIRQVFEISKTAKEDTIADLYQLRDLIDSMLEDLDEDLF